MPPVLSIIVPVLNEECTLPALLKDIRLCQQKIPFEMECLVVDGGSTDRTVKICQENDFPVLISPRGRGQQMRFGAKHARGEFLLFLHADSHLTPQHCLVAVQTMQANGVVGGGFQLKFDDRHFILKFAERVNRFRFGCTKILYGDHGIFTKKEIYEKVGGISSQALFEDIDFSKRLKKQGRLVMVPPPLVTSARRFKYGGIVKTYLRMAALHVLYWLKVSPEILAKIYERPWSHHAKS